MASLELHSTSRLPDQPSPTFQYQPLKVKRNEIRLVELEPGREDSIVRCKITHVSIDDSPVFQALSYTWGNPKSTTPILLDNYSLLVTVNLEKALRHLRDEGSCDGKPRTLWIDAVCINQQDAIERNEQVQRMRSIYSAADLVVIWLGGYDEPEDREVGFDVRLWGFARSELRPGTLDTIALAFELATELNKLATQDGDMDSTLKAVHLEYHVGIWALLERIMRRSWFERLWIIQEVAVARRAIFNCGRATIGWNELQGAADYLNRAATILRPNIGRASKYHRTLDPYFICFMGYHRVMRVRPPTYRYILRLLQWTVHCKATEPRDRIYALLGICMDDNYTIVDYRKSLHSMAIEWTWKHIEKTSRLEILGACTDSRSAGLPSWIPDFKNFPGWDSQLVSASFGNGKLGTFAAGGRTISSAKMAENGAHLYTTGLLIDAIVLKLDRYLDAKSGGKFEKQEGEPALGSDSLAMILNWTTAISNHFGLQDLEFGTALNRAFTDALLVGLGCEWNKTSPSLLDRYNVWRGYRPIPKDFQSRMTDDTERVREFIGDLPSALAFSMLSRDWFITREGRIGLIREECNLEITDSIYVVPGCSQPLILRKEESGHRLMGLCYLSGVMDGEAMGGWRTGQYKEEEITLI